MAAILDFRLPEDTHTRDFRGFYGKYSSGHLREHILKKSAFPIFFPGWAKFHPNAPGLSTSLSTVFIMCSLTMVSFTMEVKSSE